jgi:predicted TIM-barrel fold metal-dependent hydrolase
MATGSATQIIDSDAHVVESERTWDFLEPAEERFRPLLVVAPNDPTLEYWVVENKIRGFRFRSLSEEEVARLSAVSGKHLEDQRARREMDDVQLRLDHMDELGIDVQVLHNTMWIEKVADTPDAEVALCRSWNRWLAKIWRDGGGRLRWSCVIPAQSIDEALAQIKTASENGAVAVCMRPLEGDRLISDPYFYPVYEQAQKLNLAIAVHISNGNPESCDLYTSPVDPLSSNGFAKFRAPTVTACHTLLMSELPILFPTLRWSFIEASAQWLPWIVREAAVRHQALGHPLPNDVLSRWRIYVTCQTEDDVPYLLKEGAGDTLMIGTDYGHFDPSSDNNAIATFIATAGIEQDAMNKILYDNPKRLYGL